MAATCNGVCHRYQALKIRKQARYVIGQKRCNSCKIFIYWDGLYYLCCNHRLQVIPRSTFYKEKYLQSKKEQKIQV